jgi:hypothetical protein
MNVPTAHPGKDKAIDYVRAVVTADQTKLLLADLASTQMSKVLASDDTRAAARQFVEVSGLALYVLQSLLLALGSYSGSRDTVLGKPPLPLCFDSGPCGQPIPLCLHVCSWPRAQHVCSQR